MISSSLRRLSPDKEKLRKTKVDLGNEPFDLHNAQQRIERLREAHVYFKLSFRNSRSSMCFSESRIIECKRISKRPW